MNATQFVYWLHGHERDVPPTKEEWEEIMRRKDLVIRKDCVGHERPKCKVGDIDDQGN